MGEGNHAAEEEVKTVRVGNENFSVVFSSRDVERLGKMGFETINQQTCSLYGEAGRLATWGIAFQSVLDVNDPLYAKELALGRALKKFTQDKAVRAKFWAAFHASCNTAKVAARVAAIARENEIKDSIKAIAVVQPIAGCGCPICKQIRLQQQRTEATV